MKKKTFIYLAILINLIGIYLLIDLATYDELIAIVSHGEKRSSPIKMVIFMTFTSIINLVFLIYFLISNKE